MGLDAGEVVIGSDIETLSDDELANLAQRTTLFARLTPMHKERIVTLLKREGHVVGFMGEMCIRDRPRPIHGSPAVNPALSPLLHCMGVRLLARDLLARIANNSSASRPSLRSSANILRLSTSR